jgi:hypothetical protein
MIIDYKAKAFPGWNVKASQFLSREAIRSRPSRKRSLFDVQVVQLRGLAAF